MPSYKDMSEGADAVVVGGGTVGGWCAWFLRKAGLAKVVVVERSTLGRGASSRAAGMVRCQGGTTWAVELGIYSRDFYLSQREQIGVDSGFEQTGYLMPAFSEAEVDQGRARVAMQQALGLEVSWLEPGEADAVFPAMAPGLNLGASYAPGDGYIDPPRNVLAYSTALVRDGVELRERTEFTGLRIDGASGSVTGVETSRGIIPTERVVLTGGPEIADVGSRAGVRISAGGTRHQVAVTEPHADVTPERLGMVFDVAEGLYWRPEEGGVLFGMSNPDEAPGPARDVDWPYLTQIQERLGELLPVTRDLALKRVWAATIDYTPDHLPILGPALAGSSPTGGDARPIGGVTVASAGGHGMMWGPGVARVAADLALEGKTAVTDVTDLGLDRFDAAGRSRLDPDPIALPFPERTQLT